MTDASPSSHRQVIIIGSGPAGLTAALYTARANLQPLVFEGLEPGGQLTTTTEVENFPGFPEGIQGPELIDRMREQAKRFGAECQFEVVTKTDFSSRPFKVWVEDSLYTADAVIIATGAAAKWLGIPGEHELVGHGVSSCATCDGFFFRDKTIAVVGGGDSAMEEATFLTRFASKVYLIHRRDSFRASKIMQQRALDNPKIEPLYNTHVLQVHGSKDTGVTGVTLQDATDQTTRDLDLQGFFVAIGHKPNTDVFNGQINLDPNGYALVEPGTVKTNISGVFACGDVQDTKYRQAITAAGSGCMAALETEKFLEALHDTTHAVTA
ncbi:MAG: thioredoxin-disulfide reductase [Cyanobacteria bacterium HKST-UBA06]|nr:thioredoxin-disulfide reductase [Cyanobacteria bacterium HKST-UBA06]